MICLKKTTKDFYPFFENNHKLVGFAREFEAKKERQHKITFSDMQLKAYDILRKNPAILDSRQERWKYIFLDEAQDASNVDIAVIMLLAEKYKQLFRWVGDIKQKDLQIPDRVRFPLTRYGRLCILDAKSRRLKWKSKIINS